MNADETDAFDKDVLLFVTKHGTIRPSDIARYKKCKHETATRSLQRLVDSGQVYAEKIGKSTYYTVRPDSLSESVLGRVRPDTPKFPPVEGIETDGCGRGSVITCPSYPHRRARNLSERLPTEGFVMHPAVKGCDISREWVRVHHNGQYMVKVDHVGKFGKFNADTLETAEWSTSKLTMQTVYNVALNPHKDGETRPYKARMVTTRTGSISKLSLYVHPRYVWYENYEHTEVMEFRQQVKDALGVLEGFGWRFDYDTITTTGKHHLAFNDPVVASHVGKYNEKEDDILHFDSSPGYPECEIYGSADPNDVEIMVKLPTIIRSFSESLQLLHATVVEVVAIQSKMVQSMTLQMQTSNLAAQPVKTEIDSDNRMYG